MIYRGFTVYQVSIAHFEGQRNGTYFYGRTVAEVRQKIDNYLAPR